MIAKVSLPGTPLSLQEMYLIKCTKISEKTYQGAVIGKNSYRKSTLGEMRHRIRLLDKSVAVNRLNNVMLVLLRNGFEKDEAIEVFDSILHAMDGFSVINGLDRYSEYVKARYRLTYFSDNKLERDLFARSV